MSSKGNTYSESQKVLPPKKRFKMEDKKDDIKNEIKEEKENADCPSENGSLLTSVIRHTSCPEHSVTYVVCKP